jgi:hypothetical protein
MSGPPSPVSRVANWRSGRVPALFPVPATSNVHSGLPYTAILYGSCKELCDLSCWNGFHQWLALLDQSFGPIRFVRQTNRDPGVPF